MEEELVSEVIESLTPELQETLARQLARVHIPPQNVRILDLTMALLRVNSEEALKTATELTGCAITKCPAAVPPWPPKPVRASCGDRRVVLVADANPCRQTRDSFRRFALVKKGMTKTQLLARGVTVRDLEQWTKKGWLKLA